MKTKRALLHTLSEEMTQLGRIPNGDMGAPKEEAATTSASTTGSTALEVVVHGGEVAERPPPGTGECFVCMDDELPAPASPCKCKRRFVHAACQTRMCAETKRNDCAVCGAPYANVHMNVHMKVSPSRAGYFVAALAACWLLCSVWLVVHFSANPTSLQGVPYHIIGILFVTTLMLTNLAMCLARRMARRELGPTWATIQSRRVVVNLRPVPDLEAASSTTAYSSAEATCVGSPNTS